MAPSVSVPTHFSKVILAKREGEQSETALGAFVLPNARIPDHTPLESFIVPGRFLLQKSVQNFLISPIQSIPWKERRDLIYLMIKLRFLLLPCAVLTVNVKS